MNNSCEERRAESSTGFYQMNILSESTELLNIEKQETVVKNVQINCCANLQCWKANNNSNNTVTEEDRTRTSCIDKLKGIHAVFKIIAVLIGIIITLSPFIPQIVAGIKTTKTATEFSEVTTTTITEISTTTTTSTAELSIAATMSKYSTETTQTTKLRQIERVPNGPFILVITNLVDESYLRSDDGSTHISATINAQSNNYADATAQALVNGKMHIFGGESDGKKIARLDHCSLNELPARLYKSRQYSHSALSIENGRKALICFGDDVKFCETFDGTSALKAFAADWSHNYGGLGLYRNQPATVGCAYERHNKAETLSATGWTALPDHPLRISSHSLVGLENQSMLLIGGYAFESGYQTGIWQLNDKEWSRFGKLLQPGGYGSALYDNRFIYLFAGDPHPYAIQRLELNESEKLEKVEVMGNQRGQFFSPVLVKTDYFCG